MSKSCFFIRPETSWTGIISIVGLVPSTCAFMWLDQKKFLQEARRILKVGSNLSIDNYGFSGAMVGNKRFNDLFSKVSSTYMSNPPRYENYPDPKAINDFGFKLETEIHLDHNVELDLNQFVEYLKTRSNFINLPVDLQIQTSTEILDLYKSSFGETKRTLRFRADLMLFRAI